MFLQLAHTKLDTYQASRKFVVECYKITESFPKDEKFALVSQIRRAALSVHLNLAEGCSRKSGAERSRFFEVSRGSVIEVDAALDIALDLNYIIPDGVKELETPLVDCYRYLSGLINATHH